MKLFGKSLFRKKHRKQQTPESDRVIFVSHEATRTGAPKIILNLLYHFADQCDIHCETILQRGGHLATDFQQLSEVDCFNIESKDRAALTKRVESFVRRYPGPLPKLAVCNSMESRFIAQALADLGIPTVSLVHELPSSYTPEDFGMMFEASERIIFPADAVREAVDEAIPLPPGKNLMLPQGLLDPEFGTRISSTEARKQLREELNLPPDSFIVLGCGTLDLRKGIDHFAAAAREAMTLQSQIGNPVHFVWVGEGPRWAHSPYHYVQIDIQKSAARDRVHFIGERSDVEPYFVGADCLLMCSRVDPFPCVIHEAMACGLPVLAFANSGGAVEAIDGGAGMVVSYADYTQIGETIRMLATQPAIASSIREKAIERVRTKYCFESYANKVIDVCEAVLGSDLRRSRGLRVHRPAA